ncbi:MAG: hypothetical protein K2K70_04740 [Lachnospiraceae bacterium]|nr:hypothetical protein [Lachnospiraceae bacterium]
MQTEIMLALWGNLKKDYTETNQLKQIDMLRMMLEINQDVVVQGISKLENYENDSAIFPLLCRGLKLVRGGMEPQAIESILLNTAFANDVDLLESLLVIDGVISIQIQRSPDVTKELLLSYFSFNLQNNLRKSLEDLKINSSEPLDMAEIEKLIGGQGS